jgi:hypothetical protein
MILSILKHITGIWVMCFFAFIRFQNLVLILGEGVLNMSIQRTRQILLKESLEGG